MKEIQHCTKCILDPTVSDIWLDSEGVSKYCHIHDKMGKKYPLNEKTRRNFEKLIEKIKREEKNKKYDYTVSVSGRLDTSHTLYSVVKLGLRPLAGHFDNGWNSDFSVKNS